MYYDRKKELLKIISGIAILAVSAFFFVIVFCKALSGPPTTKLDLSSVPITWDKSYVEDEQSYETQFATENWDTYVPNPSEEFTTVVLEDIGANFSEVESFATSRVTHRTPQDIYIINLTENDAWNFISNGIYKSYPSTSYAQNAEKLAELKNTNTETITVKCWYWSNPSDNSDMSKTTVTKTFAVNSKLAETFQHIFQDIYDNESKPVINIADAGMGTWVLRGKSHKSSNTMSAHSLGVCIDINPSTGSFYVNGTWYGNAYGQKAMPYSIWKQLPECHKKYHVIYDGSPIVEIFKAYGFYWGGDWKSGTDCMHFAYLGDGKSARSTGIRNYQESGY